MRNVIDNQEIVINSLPTIISKLNEVLDGKHLKEILPILKRIDSSKHLPLWFNTLQKEGRLPNLDGKTVGSVIEKLLVCVLEKYIFKSKLHLSINPAKGVDIPELELGVKSPSTNFCTSEPYFSAYERLLGNEYDALILLTNYQEAKNKNPFRLQILQGKYLKGTEIADSKLCSLAKALRSKYTDEPFLKKAIRFLSYINQSDWEANCILKLFEMVLISGKNVKDCLKIFEKDFEAKNTKSIKLGKTTLSEESLKHLKDIALIKPQEQGVIMAAENWVIITQKDNGRFPNDNEWHRFMTSPLNGKIGMSFALQWRYNFGLLFSKKDGA